MRLPRYLLSNSCSLSVHKCITYSLFILLSLVLTQRCEVYERPIPGQLCEVMCEEHEYWNTKTKLCELPDAATVTKLEKGIYSLQVYTKTIDAEDYGEITDMFEELNEETTIGNKTYKVTYNKDKRDRLELIVK